MSTFTVAPIGTCRLNSPLRRGAARLGFTLQNSRNYGYTHNSTEAVQQLRFMLGEIHLPEDVAPLIGRRGTVTAPTGKYLIADLYLIEISSAKLLTCRGWPVQLNYVIRYFADFFSDRDRTRWFWQLAREDRGDEFRQRLSLEPSYLRLNPIDQGLLADLRMAETDSERLHRDIDGLVERLGKDRIVLVTHVGAQMPDGSTIASRSHLIAQVGEYARNNGIRCYDPTPAMEAMGQDRALKTEGLDTTHYTEAFADLLCDDFHALFMPQPVVPEIEVGSPVAINIELGTIERLKRQWERADFRSASREVRQRIADGDDTPGLQDLFGRMAYELGDYTTALQALDIAREQQGPDDAVDQMRMVSAHRLGDYAVALRIGEGLLADETENDEIVEVCARSSYQLNRIEASIDYWKRLFWLRDGDEDVATTVLTLLGRHDLEEARSWRDAVLDKMPGHGEALKHLWNDLVEQRDRARLLAVMSAFSAVPANDLFELVDIAAEVMPLAAARLIAARVAIPNELGEVSDRLRDVAADLGALWAKQALACDQKLAAVEPLQAAYAVDPARRDLVPLLKSVSRGLRIEARDALATHDFERALAICNECLATGFEFPELRSFLARALLDIGRPHDAMVHLRFEAEASADQGAAWHYVERCAIKAGLYADAIEAGMRARDAGGANAEAATKQLESIATRSLRDIRRMIAEGEYEDAWRLSAAMLALTPDEPSVLREQNVIVRALRATMVEGESDLRLGTAKRILALVPSDHNALRVAAVETMRSFAFQDALEFWRRLRETGRGGDRVDANISKCSLFIEREQRRAAPVALAA